MTAAEIIAAVRKVISEGFTLLADDLTPEIEAAFRARGAEIATQLKVGAPVRGLVDREAVKYAQSRAGELISDFAESTPEMFRATITKAVEEGWSIGRLRGDLRENYAFSPERALTIARSETAIAKRAGGNASATAAGAQSKSWSIESDDPCALCLSNASVGWIAIDDEFPEGDDPHPNCVDSIEYRTEPADDDDDDTEPPDDDEGE